VPNHLLGDYLRSLLAVLLGQFSRKRFPGGMDGVVRLAEKSEPIQASTSCTAIQKCLLEHHLDPSFDQMSGNFLT